ncbi:MAG TPA: PQQ-binding-like beta-propeller repeat protein [Candidatus Limnocylindrales bacterium]|nr:PQQ-binding-like beta-propeller repeat protein [Candidatus Limnocylindrales bacterium]
MHARKAISLIFPSLLLAACSALPAPTPSSTAALPGPIDSPAATGSASESAIPSLVPSPTAISSPAASAPAPSTPSGPTAAPTPQPPAFAAWPTYGGNRQRSGVAASGFPAPNRPAIAWNVALDGAVYGQPIIATGRLLVATEHDSVYALSPSTGRALWRRHLGTPVPLSSLPCGNIDPLGITSTPVFDPATGSLFVVAEVTGPKHVLFALNPATGGVRWSRTVDWPGQDPRTHQQRAGLALANGRVYVGFGGLAGDCGQYNGVVVGVPTSGQGASVAYVVPTAREGAVWATGGPVIDAAGNLYISVGNGSSTSTYDGSDSVVELSPTLKQLSFFAPSTWASDNAGDRDLGSMSPVLLSGGWVFIDGKSGTGYVLRQGSLGGIGGQVSARSVCRAFGASAHVGSTAYVPCTDGIRAVTVSSSGAIQIAWHTSSGASGPPAIGGGTVWSVNIATGVLYALSQSSGAVRASIRLGAVPHFDAPSLSGGFVFVGTLRGVIGIKVAR